MCCAIFAPSFEACAFLRLLGSCETQARQAAGCSARTLRARRRPSAFLFATSLVSVIAVALALMQNAACAVTLPPYTYQHKGPRAAVFTPYYLTTGGGEKYLLSTVRAMQTFGYHVDILVEHSNICLADKCVLELARTLRVPLNDSLYTLRVVYKDNYRVYAGPYEVFFALGNEKSAQVHGLGRVNIYMCQFPFDLEREVPKQALDAHASYDAVILNSYYSLSWYYQFSVPMYKELNTMGKLFPRVQVVHPPVTMLKRPGQKQSLRPHIVMVGRFFAGRQSKGHEQAIKLFAQLIPDLPEETNLIMVGNPMPGHTSYIANLHSLIQQLALDSRVQIVLAAPAAKVMSILRSGLVQWHLTGLGVQDDPASLEHFGISIVEGMSLGCIPIAYTGGASDIIKPGVDGFVAYTAEHVLKHTRTIFNMTAAQQQRMQANGIERSQFFEYARFEQHMHNLFRATAVMKPIAQLPPSSILDLRKDVSQLKTEAGWL